METVENPEEEPVAVSEGKDWRGILAYVLMGVFVVSTAVGAAIYALPLGFIVLGITSGIYGKLLGDN